MTGETPEALSDKRKPGKPNLSKREKKRKIEKRRENGLSENSKVGLISCSTSSRKELLSELRTLSFLAENAKV